MLNMYRFSLHKWVLSRIVRETSIFFNWFFIVKSYKNIDKIMKSKEGSIVSKYLFRK